MSPGLDPSLLTEQLLVIATLNFDLSRLPTPEPLLLLGVGYFSLPQTALLSLGKASLGEGWL